MKINKKQISISVPILFIVGSILHFLFDLTGKIGIIGIFAPVNESIWEHLKLAFYPIIVWWLIVEFNKKNIICSNISATISMLVITNFFYTYTGAFGIQLMILDILSLLFGDFIGQILAFHLYEHLKYKKIYLISSIICILFIFLLFIIFTFYPPKLPLFKDPITGLYGIF